MTANVSKVDESKERSEDRLLEIFRALETELAVLETEERDIRSEIRALLEKKKMKRVLEHISSINS